MSMEMNIFDYISAERTEDFMKGPKYDEKGKLVGHSILGSRNEFSNQEKVDRERKRREKELRERNVNVNINRVESSQSISSMDKSLVVDRVKLINQNMKRTT